MCLTIIVEKFREDILVAVLDRYSGSAAILLMNTSAM